MCNRLFAECVCVVWNSEGTGGFGGCFRADGWAEYSVVMDKSSGNFFLFLVIVTVVF